MSLVTINVSGTIFQTEKATLRNISNTRLSNPKLFQENFKAESGQFFFDRDAQIFSYILNYYRTEELHLPAGMCSASIKKELEFWRIPEERVSECCWKELYQVRRETKALKELNDLFHDEVADFIMSFKLSSEEGNKLEVFKHQLWMFLEYPMSSLKAKIWEIFYFSLVVLSALLFLLDTVQSLREPDRDMGWKCNQQPGQNITLILDRSAYYEALKLFTRTKPIVIIEKLDILTAILFAIEFMVRFSVCPRKNQFCKDYLNILDGIFLLSKIPSMYMEKSVCLNDPAVLWCFTILKTVSIIRLFRLLRIRKSCKVFRVMFLSIKASAKELILMVGSFACTAVLFAAIIFIAELHKGTFSNTFHACWWAVITMTTVGYGDVTPVTPVGRVIGAVCALTGLVVLTLPIAVIGSNFSDYNSINREREMFIEGKKKTCTKRKCWRSQENKVSQTVVEKF